MDAELYDDNDFYSVLLSSVIRRALGSSMENSLRMPSMPVRGVADPEPSFSLGVPVAGCSL